jgi:hypothetical protein
MAMIQVHALQCVINQSDIQKGNGQLLAKSTIHHDHFHYNHSNENSKGELMELIHLKNFAELKKDCPSMKIPTM